MTTKDYVYLGLILLTALAFYCNGFYAGVYRCKRVYDKLIDEAESDNDETLPISDSGKLVLAEDKVFAASDLPREHGTPLPGRNLRGDFRNN
jgi:hypothetical protein